MTAPLRGATAGLTRRHWLWTSVLPLLGAAAAPAWADMGAGPVSPPRPAPALVVRRQDGRRVALPEQLRGRWSAVQLMFAGCSAVCPLQGALFADLQAALAAAQQRNVQLLSLSIDPLADDPAALGAWLKRFGAQAQWQAASPLPAELDRMLDALGRQGIAPGDRHSAQVMLFDPQARMVWRTGDLPPPDEVLAALRALQRQPPD